MFLFEFDKSLLKLMDAHISQFIIDNDYKPSTGFDNFYEMNKKVIETEIERLINHDKDKDIYAKIKKTYNKYKHIKTKQLGKHKINNK